MSLSFTVSFNSIPKKLTVAKSSTVAALVADAAKKHQVSGAFEIWYNNKKIDGSLPLRFTNLVNNCKLELKRAAVPAGPIRCKVVHPSGSQIARFDGGSTLKDVVELVNLSGNLLVSVVNDTVAYQGHEHVTLVELGAVDNTVIRISHVDEKKQQLKQQEEALIRQREQERAVRVREEARVLKEQNEARNRQAGPDKAPDSPEKEPESDLVESVDTEKAEPSPVSPPVVQEPSHPSSPAPLGAPSSQASAAAPSSEVSETPSFAAASISSANPVQVYRPSKTSTYENPDEDYVFTLDHAKRYQELIRSQAAATKPTQHVTPTQFVVRIKFPDRTLLQLQLDADNRFGELVAKIDDAVVDGFRSNYNLKLAYPPFEAIPLSFGVNATKLRDLAHFQTDQVMLVWEPLQKAKGPYLKTTDYKDFSELPEIQLEEHRAELPDSKPSRSATSSAANSGSKPKKGVPKWLKINR